MDLCKVIDKNHPPAPKKPPKEKKPKEPKPKRASKKGKTKATVEPEYSTEREPESDALRDEMHDDEEWLPQVQCDLAEGSTSSRVKRSHHAAFEEEQVEVTPDASPLPPLRMNGYPKANLAEVVLVSPRKKRKVTSVEG